MRLILAIGAAMALAACSSNETANVSNTVELDNMAVGTDTAMNDTMGMDGNAAMDAETQNMMMEDATTHDADTNLSNGI